MMAHARILVYVSEGERFARRCIRGKVAQSLAALGRVSQEDAKYPGHPVHYISQSETFAESFGRQT
jgi:hypothetical protein